MNLISVLKTFLQANVIQPGRLYSFESSVRGAPGLCSSRDTCGESAMRARASGRLPDVSFDTPAFGKERK